MGSVLSSPDPDAVDLNDAEVRLVGAVVVLCKDLEGFLSVQLGATGTCKGLHEMITAVEPRLLASSEPGLVKKLRWLATMRNKAVHEKAFRISAQVSLDEFQQSCRDCKAQLRTVVEREEAAAAAAKGGDGGGCVVS